MEGNQQISKSSVMTAGWVPYTTDVRSRSCFHVSNNSFESIKAESTVPFLLIGIYKKTERRIGPHSGGERATHLGLLGQFVTCDNLHSTRLSNLIVAPQNRQVK